MNRGSSRGPGRSRSWTIVNDHRPDRRWLRTVAAVVGVLSLALALALVTGVGGERFADAVVTVVWPGRIVVFVAAHFALVLGVWSLWQVWTSSDEGNETTLPAPGTTENAGDAVVGGDLDAVLESLTDPDETVQGWKRVDVEGEVQSVAVDVLRSDAGYEFDELRDALESGTWTDDPRAATYLGSGVALPIRLRVIDWASGDPYRRQVRATVVELAEIAGVETEVERP